MSAWAWIYVTLAALTAMLNLRGILVMLRTGSMTITGVQTTKDWLRLGWPLFVNAVGSACVWPLLLPGTVVEMLSMARHGLPRIAITQHKPIDLPSEEVMRAQCARAERVVATAMNEAFARDEDMHALSVAHALVVLAWYQVRMELVEEQGLPRAEAESYFVASARRSANWRAEGD